MRSATLEPAIQDWEQQADGLTHIPKTSALYHTELRLLLITTFYEGLLIT
ncbi:hypothetical protein DET56_103311 [Paenibacillus pabuli]|uniref:Uncharacterized protein n=1 Tax=Paenibacillus pabuli TaxID=1472 RepID=A0A855XY78_9BACL|nr:hypothetical protein DET56_103311 [Paenibacillus pabuli]PXW09169.1 hypothetical protein DEU73_103307 [Paenibacillus taichungensis]